MIPTLQIGQMGLHLLLPGWNPQDKTGTVTVSPSRLQVDEAGSSVEAARVWPAKASGTAYFEVILSLASGSPFNCGIGLRRLDEAISTAFNLGQTMAWRSTNATYNGSSGATISGTLPTFASGDVLIVYVDFDAKKMWLGKNGVWTGDPTAGTGATFSGWTANDPGWAPYWFTDNTGANHRAVLNLGGSAFTYTPPLSCPGWN